MGKNAEMFSNSMHQNADISNRVTINHDKNKLLSCLGKSRNITKGPNMRNSSHNVKAKIVKSHLLSKCVFCAKCHFVLIERPDESCQIITLTGGKPKHLTNDLAITCRRRNGFICTLESIKSASVGRWLAPLAHPSFLTCRQ